MEFGPSSLPALITASDVVEIETIVPDPHLQRLYVKLNYYYYQSQQTDGPGASAIDIVSRLYWLALSDGKYEEYIELPYRSNGDDQSYAQTQQLLGIADGSRLVFYSLPVDNVMDVLVMDLDGAVLLRRTVNLPAEQILFVDFNLSSEGVISALIGHEREARVLWWRLDRELARLVL